MSITLKKALVMKKIEKKKNNGMKNLLFRSLNTLQGSKET